MPCSTRSVAASPAANPGSSARAAPAGHILLVDDDSAIRGHIALLLRGSGYRVDTAGDGGTGLIALYFNPYDLLITEHEMPKLSGLDLLRRMRACPLLLPAIMISGFIPWEEADLEWSLRPGAVVEKPFSFGALLAKVRMLLPGRSDRFGRRIRGSPAALPSRNLSPTPVILKNRPLTATNAAPPARHAAPGLAACRAFSPSGC